MKLDLDDLRARILGKLERVEEAQTEIQERLDAVRLVRVASKELGELEEETHPTSGEIEQAVLEVLKVLEQPLNPKAIAEELAAVGYPLEVANPVDSIDAALQAMFKEGRVKKMKGNVFVIQE